MDPAAWDVPRLWDGQTAFIVAGGPSASRHDLDELLLGQNVIAVNSAWKLVPRSCKYVFFNDDRWWQKFGHLIPPAWRVGKLVTTSKLRARGLLHLIKVKDLHEFDARARSTVFMKTTSISGAIGLAILLGATTIVLVGADGQLSADGRRHAHDDAYPWPLRKKSFASHGTEMLKLASLYKKAGVTVVNASPGSVYQAFPIVDLEDYVKPITNVPSIERAKGRTVWTRRPSASDEKILAARASEALDRFINEVSRGVSSPDFHPRVLDVGSGEGAHARAMSDAGFSVTTCDPGHTSDLPWAFLSDNVVRPPQGYDGVWLSHVLEHQTDVGATLRKARDLLASDGVLCVTVPPFKHSIVGGHLTVWNEGLLLYNLVVAGFDCSQARVGTYGYNISVIVRRKDAALPVLKYDQGDIELLAPFFPVPVRQGFDGRLGNVRW